MDELRLRNVVRSNNNPLGDYTEFLFARAFNWKLENNSSAGHDASDAEGQRYQIKGRRIIASNGSRQLSSIRRLPEKAFHFLAAALFNADYSVRRAIILPHALIEPRSKFSQHVNGWIFHLDDAVWSLPEIRDVTDELKAASV